MSLMSTRPELDRFFAVSSPRSPDQNASTVKIERPFFRDRPVHFSHPATDGFAMIQCAPVAPLIPVDRTRSSWRAFFPAVVSIIEFAIVAE
jgi:hypothetical protein